MNGKFGELDENAVFVNAFLEFNDAEYVMINEYASDIPINMVVPVRVDHVVGGSKNFKISGYHRVNSSYGISNFLDPGILVVEIYDYSRDHTVVKLKEYLDLPDFVNRGLQPNHFIFDPGGFENISSDNRKMTRHVGRTDFGFGMLFQFRFKVFHQWGHHKKILDLRCISWCVESLLNYISLPEGVHFIFKAKINHWGIHFILMEMLVLLYFVGFSYEELVTSHEFISDCTLCIMWIDSSHSVVLTFLNSKNVTEIVHVAIPNLFCSRKDKALLRGNVWVNTCIFGFLRVACANMGTQILWNALVLEMVAFPLHKTMEVASSLHYVEYYFYKIISKFLIIYFNFRSLDYEVRFVGTLFFLYGSLDGDYLGVWVKPLFTFFRYELANELIGFCMDNILVEWMHLNSISVHPVMVNFEVTGELYCQKCVCFYFIVECLLALGNNELKSWVEVVTQFKGGTVLKKLGDSRGLYMTFKMKIAVGFIQRLLVLKEMFCTSMPLSSRGDSSCNVKNGGLLSMNVGTTCIGRVRKLILNFNALTNDDSVVAFRQKREQSFREFLNLASQQLVMNIQGSAQELRAAVEGNSLNRNDLKRFCFEFIYLGEFCFWQNYAARGFSFKKHAELVSNDHRRFKDTQIVEDLQYSCLISETDEHSWSRYPMTQKLNKNVGPAGLLISWLWETCWKVCLSAATHNILSLTKWGALDETTPVATQESSSNEVESTFRVTFTKHQHPITLIKGDSLSFKVFKLPDKTEKADSVASQPWDKFVTIFKGGTAAVSVSAQARNNHPSKDILVSFSPTFFEILSLEDKTCFRERVCHDLWIIIIILLNFSIEM